MNALYDLLIRFSDWIWGWPMLIFLILSGLYLGARIGGIQFTKFGYIMKNTLGAMTKSTGEGGVTGFQAVSAALAATLGTGNIVGIGIGIANGGPGAVFWMWLIGLIAMGIKYSEVICSVKFREKRENGEYSAGPFMYISKGLKNKSLGRVLAVAYVAVMIVALLVASGVHTGAVVDSLEAVKVPRLVSTVITIAFLVFIVFGGIQRIVNFTEKLVPIMSVLYIIGCIAVIVVNVDNFIPSFLSIFEYAFQPHAAVGGFTGAAVAATVRWGVARGMYSNDSGNGIQSIAHGQADVDHPIKQAIWGVFEVFFSTMVVCSFSALAILSSGAWSVYGAEGAGIVAQRAFSESLGTPGLILITIAVVLFAFSTVLGFSYFVENQASSLFGNRAGKFTQVIYIVFMAFGGMYGVAKIVPIADFMNAWTILINMTAVLALGKMVGDETKDYFRQVEGK